MAIDKDNPMFPGFDVEPSPVDVELQQPTTMDPSNVTFDEEGGALIDFNPAGSMAHGSPEFTKNIAEEMDEGELAHLSAELIGQYQIDRESRADWEQTYIKGLDLLGFKMEDRAQPFQGASGVSHPLLAESITQFQAQAYKELLPAGGPVRTQVIGKETDETTAQSERVKDFMNYQITHVMEEFDPELDQMLFYLPLSGSAFKKVYYDQNLQRAVSKFIPSEDLVVPYLATDLDSCERVTHIIKMMNNDLRKHQISGFYKDVELEPYQLDEKDLTEAQRKLEGTQKTTGNMEQHQILEFHVLLDLPGFEDKDEKENETGIKLPYIVTIHEESGQIIGIRRNWREEDELKDKIPYFIHYKFLPGLGFYGFGLIHMLGGLSKTATSALRQLLDAGTLSNLPAGFKAKGLRVKEEDEPLQPGEWRDVDAGGQAIRDSLMPLPYKEPSVTLFNLLGFCVEAGRRFAAIADLQIGEGNQNAPVGTTIAMLERGTKVMSAIHKRLHCAQKAEFNLLAIVFRDYLPPEYPYAIVGGERSIKAEDFDDRVDILPVSDPNVFSLAQRISMAQTQLQMAQVAPEIHNMFEAYKRMYHALGVENIEAILPTPAKEMPRDPAAENAASLKMEQLRAFMGQNHDDHVQAHLAFMMSPIVTQNPPVQGALQSHLMEHIGLKAREEVESNMQQSIDPNAPPELMQQAKTEAERQIASRIAKYTGEVIGQLNEAMGQLGQDPLIALKDKELGIKSQDVQRKTQADQSKQQIEQAKLGAKVQSDENKTGTQEDIAKLRAQVQYDKMANDNRKTNAKMVFDKMKEDGKNKTKPEKN